MKTKLAIFFVLLLFGWAMVRTENLGQVGERFKKPPQKAPVCQIEVPAETSQYRLIKHALGETKVPLAPKRIVSLSMAATDGLAVLGIRPVLIESALLSDGPAAYLADRLKDVPMIRRSGGINLEAVLAANPDLIIASGAQDGKLYAQLSKIAPTVVFLSTVSTDRENLILDVGDIVGMPEQAKQCLADYRQYTKQAREKLAATAKDQPVAFLRFRRNTCVIYAQTTMFGPLLFDQLGLMPDPAMPMVMSAGGWDVLSVERLSMLSAEHIFMVIDKDSEAYLQSIMETPIWREIPAVKHGHVHRVESSTWLGGEGILGCEAIINDVLKAMVPERST